MSKLRMPYQCLHTCGGKLIAARGSSIDAFSLEDHSLLSTWKCPSNQQSKTTPISSGTKNESTNQNSELSEDIVLNSAAPPAKRRRLSDAVGPQMTSERKGKNEKKKVNNRSDAVASGLRAPAVIALAATKDGKHVIAVTGEDKSIRVFEDVWERGEKQQLRHVSQRKMPKRPCALTILDDDTTIIAADKFGDVYSLPLLFPEGPDQVAAKSTAQVTQAESSKPFVPAANELTIHSQRNRKALENQKRQTNNPIEKLEPTFEHTLLLGHVSMLTDVALSTLQGQNYIITADRDEHIRVSRGIPQSHIIESFCLGHTEFVSRLCIPAQRRQVLISGGGDDDIFVWEWLKGRLLSKVDLKSHVEAVMGKIKSTNELQEPAVQIKVAVSGLLHIELSKTQGCKDIIIVICEGVPGFFIFQLTPEDKLKHIQTVALPGNALSILAYTFIEDDRLIVSVDTIHKPGSTTERRDPLEKPTNPLLSYSLELRAIAGPSFEVVEHEEEVDGWNSSGQLGNLLYNLENLRKRDGDAREED